MAKTFSQIMSEMIAYVNDNLGEQDTRVGTVLRESILAPVATQLEQAYARTDEVENNQTISNPGAISTEAMNVIGGNFGISRFMGSKSVGTLRFYRFLVPASTISIPAGTLATASSSSDSLSFETLSSASLSSSSPQDPVTLAYYVDIPGSCKQSGSMGNIVANGIRNQSIAGIDGVTNPYDFTGGKDEQTNAEMAELIIARAQGNLGTKGGYDSLIRSNYAVDDLSIVAPTDPESRRAQFGGSVDIMILSSRNVESTETTLDTTAIFHPTFLPLFAVSEILGVEETTEVTRTLVPGTDYDVVLDTFSPLGRGIYDKSRIDIHVTSFVLKPSSLLTITYTNSELIRVIQAFLDNEDNKVVGSDVMAKLAIKIPIIIECDIRIVPGYDSVTTASTVQQNIISYVSTYMLDNDVQASDIITVIGNVPGVDSVNLSTFLMALASSPTINLSEVLASKLEYIRTDTDSVTVNVVG